MTDTNATAPATDSTGTDALAVGDEVRFIKDGRVIVLEWVNPNPNYVADEEVFAETEFTEWGNPSVVDRSDVVLVRRAADITPKTLPTLTELRDLFAGTLPEAHNSDLRITESDTNGEPDGEFLAFGKSATGLPFGVRVTISSIHATSF